jgi:hypothetical protein
MPTRPKGLAAVRRAAYFLFRLVWRQIRNQINLGRVAQPARNPSPRPKPAKITKPPVHIEGEIMKDEKTESAAEPGGVADPAAEYKALLSDLAELKDKYLAAMLSLNTLQADCRKQEKDYRNTLLELNVDKWLFRLLFAAVIGGTIWGLTKFDDVLNNRISTHIESVDKLSLSVALANTGQWANALSTLEQFQQEAASSGYKPDDRAKRFVFTIYLWILSGMDDKAQGNTAWLGATDWEEVIRNKDFIHLITNDPNLKADADLNHNLAYCNLKFGTSLESMAAAEGYENTAMSAETYLDRKAPHDFSLALFALLKHDTQAAKEHLMKAEAEDPSRYLIEDLLKYKDSFLNSAEFSIWDFVAKRDEPGRDFRTEYEQVLHEMSPPTTLPSTKPSAAP